MRLNLKFLFAIWTLLQLAVATSTQAQLKQRLYPRLPLHQDCPPGIQYRIPRLYCPPGSFSPNVCPPESKPENRELVDPDQFLNNQPEVPETDPAINLDPATNSDFAFNPLANESGGVGHRGYIAGNQLFSGMHFSGPFFHFVDTSFTTPHSMPLTAPIAGGDRRLKVSDQFNPFPTDRVFYNHHYFSSGAFDLQGNIIDIKRHTFGLERTFLDGSASLELRLPFQTGVAKRQNKSVTAAQRGTQLGNISLSTKFLLSDNGQRGVIVGMATMLPTAPDVEVIDESFGSSDLVLRIENQTVSVLPYMAVNWNPTPSSWVTLFSQLDFSLNGDRVISFAETGLYAFGYSMSPQNIDRYNHQNLMSIDVSMGQWLFQNRNDSWIQGIAAFAELHYTSTLNDSDSATVISEFGDVNTISNLANRVDILDATTGFRSQLAGNTYLTAAFAAPLRRGNDRTFHTEFNLNLSRYFGGGQ